MVVSTLLAAQFKCQVAASVVAAVFKCQVAIETLSSQELVSDQATMLVLHQRHLQRCIRFF